MTEEEQNEIETGTVQVSVREAVSYKKIKNARVALVQQNTECFVGVSDYNGSLIFEDVPYGTYTVNITRTGYENYTNTLNVNHSSIFIPPFLTHLPVDPNFVEVDLDETYTFTITERTTPDYTMSSAIINWLKTNLESLTDDNGNTIFGKVNIGFSESTLKTYGKKPVSEVYINRVEYDGDFDVHPPVKVHTIVIFYMKGANNPTYLKATELHDYIMQEFLENETFRTLADVVQDTYIMNSELRVQSVNKGYGVVGAFELTHTLY